MPHHHTGKTCPHCGIPLTREDSVVFCGVCDTPHHAACWQANHGCAAPGCAGQAEKPVELLWESSDMVFSTGVPIALENTALILDRIQDKLFARCTFRAITDKAIRAVLIEITCRDVWGNPLGAPIQFQYLDLRTRRESKFGQTQPIELADKTTRRISVSISKILFADDTVAEGGAVHAMAAPVPLADHFGGPALTAAYAAETTPDARFAPESAGGFWRCACGSLNTDAEERCHHCGCALARLTAALNPDVLTAAVEEAQAKQRLAKSRKRHKAGLIALALTLILGVAAGCGVYFYGIPYRHYTDAHALLDSGAYDDAHQAFLALGDFKDSAAMANEALYRKGSAAMEDGNYLTAMEIFQGLGDYADSGDQFLEAKYQKAGVYLDEKNYKFAYPFYAELGDYKDSPDNLLKTILLWEAAALGSPMATASKTFVQTVTLPPEHYELYYSTILLYLNSPDFTEDWLKMEFITSASNINRMLTLLPMTYQDTAQLKDFFGWCAGMGGSPYRAFREQEDFLRQYWSTSFVQGLAEHDDYIGYFLEGYWTTADGSYYLNFYEEEDGGLYSEYNLPWVAKPAGAKYYDIRDLIYLYTDDDSKELAKVYRFELVNYDTIRVFCYKNNRTYTLYR